MDQKIEFLSGEGDAWLERNRVTLERGSNDYLSKLLHSAGARPTSVLEIGCSNGRKLAAICAEFQCRGTGIDPSSRAISEGRALNPNLKLEVASADSLPFEAGAFDLVVFGFCLYLCDRKDLFRIAAEADRCLSDGGMLAITDFMPPFAYRNRYSHREGLFSFKFDYRKLFLWNPSYHECALCLGPRGDSGSSEPDDRVATALLRKDLTTAWPEQPRWS